MALAADNRVRQAALGRRAQTIAEVAQRSRNVPLIRDLVVAAQQEPNVKIRQLLTKYGIVFAPTLPAPALDPQRDAPPDGDTSPPLSPSSPEREP
jgi:hypothetical protein